MQFEASNVNEKILNDACELKRDLIEWKYII